MPTTAVALERANEVLADVTSLLEHHPAHDAPTAGRPAGPGYGHLMRSGTSLCYTAWEVYVEEALLDTVRQLTDERAPNDLPDVLRRWVEQQQPSPWSFTGDAWKAEVVELAVREVRGDGQGRFGLNTANVPHVTALYKNVLGCTPLQVVHWQRKANPTVRRDIQALVRVRGEIVHQGKTPDTLTLAKVRYWANFVQRLCEKFEEQLVAFRDNVGLF